MAAAKEGAKKRQVRAAVMKLERLRGRDCNFDSWRGSGKLSREH